MILQFFSLTFNFISSQSNQNTQSDQNTHSDQNTQSN